MEKYILLKFFSEYIRTRTGVHYPVATFHILEDRLIDFARKVDITSLEQLFSQFQNSVDRKWEDILIDLTTKNPKWFFSEPKLFEIIFSQIVPEICDRKNSECIDRNLQMWQLPIGGGQDAYSLAISFFENELNMPVKIVSSDISSANLGRAKRGEFTQLEIEYGLSNDHIRKYFRYQNGRWAVKKEIKDIISFSYFNLLNSIYPQQQYDIVLCPNVLTYFQKQEASNILEKIFRSLRPQGVLVVGQNEPVLSGLDQFKPIMIDDFICYRKK